MRSIDTNVLLRLIVTDDSRQTAIADNFVEQGAWVSSLVLTEAVWVLGSVYRYPAEDVFTAIAMLLHHRDLILQDTDAVAEALHLFRSRPSMRFSDCMILELARKAGHLPLGTFDRALARAEGVHLLAARR